MLKKVRLIVILEVKNRNNEDKQSKAGNRDLPENSPNENKKGRDFPDLNHIEEKDNEMNNKPSRMEKYKDNQKIVQQSEANDNHMQHQMKIINYTNSNRSAPNESYYDNKDHDDNFEEIVENLGEDEEKQKESKKKIVEELENLEDEIIIINQDSVKEERTNRNNQEEAEEVKEIKNKDVNFGLKFNVRAQEEMSDFDDVTKGQNVIVMKNSQPKENVKEVSPQKKKRRKNDN